MAKPQDCGYQLEAGDGVYTVQAYYGADGHTIVWVEKNGEVLEHTYVTMLPNTQLVEQCLYVNVNEQAIYRYMLVYYIDLDTYGESHTYVAAYLIPMTHADAKCVNLIIDARTGAIVMPKL